MIRVILLDSGPLGTATRRRGVPDADACRKWVLDLEQVGVRVLVPEISDYEIRRELIRAAAIAGITRLDAFNAAEPDRYLPITTAAIRHAANLWAEARNKGYATADPKALDGDVILAAQALSLGLPKTDFIVATENIGHLSRYVPAAEWRSIKP